MRFATKAVHEGQIRLAGHKPISPPIFQSSTYVWDDIDTEPDFNYSRYQNPNRQALEQAVASLENGRYATAFGSGMAAITAALSIAQADEKVLIANDIYGGTVALSRKVLPRQGIEVRSFDALDPSTITPARVLIFETPTNPTLRIADVSAVVAQARSLGVITILDNTFATPYLQNPLDLGVDIVMHSTTKYLGGHSDVVGGVLATNQEELQEHFVMQAKVAGSVPGPFDTWLVLRGIRTLSARMRIHQENAMAIANFLSQHPKVGLVNYPGLPAHPGHELAKRQMRGFGGMISFTVGESADDVRKFVKGCRLAAYAASLGGIETLMSWPPKLSHTMITEEERLAKGILPNLLRLSVGLEDQVDLIEDIEQALNF